MELSGSSFKGFGGKILMPCRSPLSLGFGYCLRLLLAILFCVFINGTSQGTSAERQVKVTEGSAATLNCTTGNISSPVNVSWSRKDGKTIPQDVTQVSLKFMNVNKSMAGVYVCTYYISGTMLGNDTVKLIIEYPAEVIDVLPSSFIEIKPEDNEVLRCNISAVPPVNSVTWMFNGISLKVSKSTTFGISNVKCSDAGIYQCFPHNGVVPATRNGTFNVTVRDQPGKVNFLSVSSTAFSIFLQWAAPSNGCLPLTYIIGYWVPKNVKNIHNLTEKPVGTSLNTTLTGLMPYTLYKVYLRAQNAKGNGEKDIRSIMTDVGVSFGHAIVLSQSEICQCKGFHLWLSESCTCQSLDFIPSEPLSLEAKSSSCQVKVKWKKPFHENGPVVSYRLSYRENSSTKWTHIENIKKTNYTVGKEVVCSNSKVQCLYNFKVTANTSAGYGNQSKLTVIDGLPLQGCATISNGGEDFPLTVLFVVLAIIFIAIIFIIAAICVRNKCRSCKMPFKGLFPIDQAMSSPSLSRNQSYKEKREQEAVPYEKFWQHVTLRHADSNYRFSSEFESLQAKGMQEKNKKLTWIQSQRPENQTKNRFANVVAYDQTRVMLSTIDGIQGSHYINANYVDSYKAMNFYIATQGPLANTMADFWRMVWEQNSRVIVMITKIIEKGRHKCAQYWPTKNRKSDDHGPLRVTFLREEHFAFYTVREFEIKPIKESTHYSQFKHPSSLTNGRTWDSTDEAVKPMRVQQFHFTGWPDHGVPDPGFEIPVLDFIFKSTAAQVEGAGPMIVHCSAGVGRSGAFIVIDSMIKRIHDNGDLNIFSFLAHIRQQRNHLVQEECQYIFVHDVLLEYITCGFLLSLPKKALKEHLYKIRTQPQSCGKTKIVVEFERLKNINIQEYNLKEGQRTCNVGRNRNPDIIPVDSCRVKLYPRPGVEGSDYINASYIDGFWRREAYISTQYPLESTIFDFWRMIWQENCRSIVMLLSKEEWEQSSYPRYLPVVHDTASFGIYEVTMESESARGDFMIRDLKMTSINEPGETRKIRHFHFIHWPEQGFPWSGQSILQLVSKVDEWEKEVRSNSKPFDMIGPVVVHCSTGIGRTGVYCILHTLWHQVTREDVVSVYPTARLHFHQRPSFLLTQAQYEFCYDTMVEYIDADCSLYLV